MARKEESRAEEPMSAVELLQQKIEAMKEAQKVFATFTQEQVDRIFF